MGENTKATESRHLLMAPTGVTDDGEREWTGGSIKPATTLT
jgi:hypothetical protein